MFNKNYRKILMRRKVHFPVHLTNDWRNNYTVLLNLGLVIFGRWVELAWGLARYLQESLLSGGRYFRDLLEAYIF